LKLSTKNVYKRETEDGEGGKRKEGRKKSCLGFRWCVKERRGEEERNEGREEGREQGREEGREKGLGWFGSTTQDSG